MTPLINYTFHELTYPNPILTLTPQKYPLPAAVTTSTTDPTSTVTVDTQRIEAIIAGLGQGQGLGLGSGQGLSMTPPHVVTVASYDWGYIMHLGAQVGHPWL